MASTQRRGLVLAVIMAGYLLVLIDVSILMVALPRIHRDLGFSATSLSWAQNAYTLTFGGLLLLGARAGDLLGRRRTFIAGIALFAAASLAVGLAQSPAWMIGARAVQGIGAAILAPSTLALLSTSFPEGRQRTRAMAAYGALAGIGTAFGLIVGGVLTTALSWRLGFFINVPVALAAILAAPRLLPETQRHTGRLDIPGAFASTIGISALVFATCTPPTRAAPTRSRSPRSLPALCSSQCSLRPNTGRPSRSCRCACSPAASAPAPTPRASCSTACC